MDDPIWDDTNWEYPGETKDESEAQTINARSEDFYNMFDDNFYEMRIKEIEDSFDTFLRNRKIIPISDSTNDLHRNAPV